MLRRTAIAAATMAGPLLTVTPAMADLSLCNKTASSMSVAFGHLVGKTGWVSVGWFVLTPGECKSAYDGRMPSNYYYTYVTGEAAEPLSSPAPNQKGGFFCISPTKFRLENRRHQKGKVLDCESKGYETAQFTEFKTTGAARWVHNFTNGPARSLPTRSATPAPPPTPPPALPSAPRPQPAPGGTACERFPNLC